MHATKRWWHDYWLKREAEQDAEHGNNQGVARINHRIGPPLVLDPVNNPQHLLINTTILEKTRLTELRIRRQEALQARRQHPALFSLLLVGGIVAVGEFGGGLLLFQDIGVDGIHRVVFSLLFAVTTVYLVYVASNKGGNNAE